MALAIDELATTEKTTFDSDIVHNQRSNHSPISTISEMVFSLKDKYVDPLTDFGFKRIFGTEPNKRLLMDFLNTLLPDYHRIQDLTFKNTENLGNKPIDRKAIFDIYCQTETGERLIVEIQKAKQNFFKDRSVYYATFPIQEQAEKGYWNYQLKAVYTVGVLDFVFDDHKEEDTLLHTIELKDQRCKVFYDKLKFIYIELPKFKKNLEQLESHFDKWLFLLKHLADLDDRPQLLQEDIFQQLFDVAEIANFSPAEQNRYENSLKYYRDLNNVVETSRQEGREEGREEGRQAGWQAGQESKAIEIAQQLLSVMDDETISCTTQLPLEAVQKLRQNLQNSDSTR